MGDSDLEIRLTANEKYSTNDLNAWIRSFVNIIPGDKVLDVCCGTGKQLLMYHEMIGDEGEIHGLDASEDNLKQLRGLIPLGYNVFLYHCYVEDILKELEGFMLYFDWVICTYGLYYSATPHKTIGDLNDLVKPDGKLCIIGPARHNNMEFFEMINSISTIPRHIIHTSTTWMDDFVIPSCVTLFNEFDVYEFRNEVIYPDPESLLSYWKSTTYYNPDISLKLEMLIKDYFDHNATFKLTKEALGIKCWD